MNSLTKFYKKEKTREDSITKILQGNTKLSLRIAESVCNKLLKKIMLYMTLTKKKIVQVLKSNF